MNKSYSIKTKVNPNKTNNIKIKLEQEVDQFQILSLKIDQENEYNNFNCNHGVLVGRVVANGGVGIPNAKLSVFIPLTDEDANNPDILAAYPYKNPRDKNQDGKRYNLLPRVATQNGDDGTYSPRQPFGSFPIKEEFITNPVLAEVYQKYYKYTTVTNNSGDYMIFGAPVGIQTIHLSVDITDIGRFSMKPATMITNLGFSPNLFIDDGTRIKPSNDLDDLPNIETQEIAVDIIPFCGDEETFDIGITRQDFRIRAELVNSFTIFGANFTMPEENWWGKPVGKEAFFGDAINFNPSAHYTIWDSEGYPDSNAPSVYREGIVDEKILYIPNTISDDVAQSYGFNAQDQLLELDRNRYVKRVRDGNFIYQIACNRKKIITNEAGVDVEVAPDSPEGIFTEFYGIGLFEMSEEIYPIGTFSAGGVTDEKTYRAKLRVPQAFDTNQYPDNSGAAPPPNEYLGKFKIFKSNRLYSVTQFLAVESNESSMNLTTNLNPADLCNHINTGAGSNGMLSNTQFGDNNVFGTEWLNFCLFFPQYETAKDTEAGPSSSNPTDKISNACYFYGTDKSNISYYRNTENKQAIGAGLINSRGYIRADKHFTDFIEVPLGDLQTLLANRTRSTTITFSFLGEITFTVPIKGYRTNEPQLTGTVTQTSIETDRTGNNLRQPINTGLPTLADIGFAFDEYGYRVNNDSDAYIYVGLGNSSIEFVDESKLL